MLKITNVYLEMKCMQCVRPKATCYVHHSYSDIIIMMMMMIIVKFQYGAKISVTKCLAG